MLDKPTIGFAGMSHLGLVSSTATAAKGFSVICYDSNASLIAKLNLNELPFEEPALAELTAANKNSQRFSADINDLKQCDVVYIAIDVKTNADNTSDLRAIRTLINDVSAALNDSTTLVILSQVPPGFCRQLNLPAAQLYYQVETLIFGQAVDRALHPERFIIGSADPTQTLPPAFSQVLRAFNCPILPMRYESAELAKLAINLFLASSVSTTNVLAEISRNVGADWNEIVPTLKLDKRIGPHAYLKPGLGIAGGNIERDLATIIQLGDRYHANTGVVAAWFENSKYQKDWVYRCLCEQVLPHQNKPVIALLGLAYKADTDSLKNAPSLVLLEQIKNHTVRAHDFAVSADKIPAIDFFPEIEDAVRGADVLIIMTPWPAYSKLSTTWLAEKMAGKTVIDPFGMLNHAELKKLGFQVFTLSVELNAEIHKVLQNV